METKQITSKINWKSNGKADFATFTSGDLHGEVLVAKVADGWVAGARVLGQLGSNLKGAGYYTEGDATETLVVVTQVESDSPAQYRVRRTKDSTEEVCGEGPMGEHGSIHDLS